MKLKHVNENYFQHMITGILFALISLASSIVLIIHSVFPFIFKRTGTNLLIWIIQKNVERKMPDSSHIQIRYNTKSVNENLPWRVVVGGEEKLAQQIYIFGSAFGEKTYVEKVAKYNLALNGKVIWSNTTAIIFSYNQNSVKETKN